MKNFNFFLNTKKLVWISILFAGLSYSQVSTNPGSTNGSLNVGVSTFSNDQGGSMVLKAANSSSTPYLNFNNFNDTQFARFIYQNNALHLLNSKLVMDSKGIEFVHSTWGNGFGSNIVCTDNLNGTTSMRFQVRLDNATFQDAMQIETSGRIAIGNLTSFPTNSIYSNYKLFVKGGVLAEEIRVALNSTWADYVFEKNYELKSLEEVENFIKENGHLPNVPNAAQVKEEGINVAEMARIQQEKIEELTLYIIELNKRLQALENQSQK